MNTRHYALSQRALLLLPVKNILINPISNFRLLFFFF